jgi:putative transposase
VPKIRALRLVLHRQPEGTIKSATFSQDATGAWYVSLVAHVEMPDTPLPPIAPDRAVGVDMGLTDLAAMSDGERLAAPRFYRRAERKLQRLQRQLSRCKKGGKNRAKARVKLARQHRKVANQRQHVLHQLSAHLVRAYDTVAIEDLNVKGIARTKRAKSVHDAGWATLRFQLTYKTHWQRKHLVAVGRFFPSSRRCSTCGAINDALTLSDREWTCVCGTSHDRDLNAAINIRDEGIRLLLAEGYPESIINAS